MIKPILFSTEMVKAILNGSKSQTRRVIKGAGINYTFLDLDENAAMTAIDRNGDEYPKDVDGLWVYTFERCEKPEGWPG